MTKPRFFKTPAAFRKWLEKNAATKSELIVGYYKVGSGRPSMTWPESVDEALCFGWIDGIRRRIDEEAYQIRFTPRKPTSTWSAVNIAKYAELEAKGLITPAGAEAWARRKPEKSVVYAYEQKGSPEFTEAELRTFKRAKRAWAHFEKAPPSTKKKVLHWLANAKKAETRARRFSKLFESCKNGEKLV